MFKELRREQQTDSKTSHSDPTCAVLQLERISCPLCNSPNTKLVQTARDNLCGIPGEFSVERCAVCQHLFMNPRPVMECLAACYPANYGPHQSTPVLAADLNTDDRQHGTKVSERSKRPLYLRVLPLRYVPGLKRLYEWLMEDLSQPVPQVPAPVSGADKAVASEMQSPGTHRALEVGCATGQYLVRLQQAGWEVTGIEPGEKPAAVAKEAGLNVQCGLLESCELQPESFDLAAAWMVIEHVPNPRQTLQNIQEVLKPGGTFLFSIPNAGCWEANFFGKNWYVLELPRHLHHFTTKSIQRLLEETGFIDVSITHQRNVSNVVGSLALMLLSKWPNSRVGRKLLAYPDTPTLALKLLLAPIAHLLARIHQGGRLTISARRSLARTTS